MYTEFNVPEGNSFLWRAVRKKEKIERQRREKGIFEIRFAES